MSSQNVIIPFDGEMTTVYPSKSWKARRVLSPENYPAFDSVKKAVAEAMNNPDRYHTGGQMNLKGKRITICNGIEVQITP